MKTLAVSAALELAACALAGAVVALAVPTEPARSSALLGVAVALALGLVALVLKLQVPRTLGKGAGLTPLFASMGLALGLRLLAVAAGAFVLKARGQAPEAFVIAFLVVYLAQQVVEVSSVRREMREPGGVSR